MEVRGRHGRLYRAHTTTVKLVRGWKVAGYVLESTLGPLPYLLDTHGGRHIVSVMAHISKSNLPTYSWFSRGRSHIIAYIHRYYVISMLYSSHLIENGFLAK